MLAREDVPGEKRLVAYVVGRSEDRRSERESDAANGASSAEKLPELTWFLSRTLLSAASFLTSAPLPQRQDRPQGPACSRTRRTWRSQTGYEAPHTAVEEALVGIWRQVLRLERVGIHDNFFELGGDSILSIQIIARARAAGLAADAASGVRAPDHRPTCAGCRERAVDRRGAGSDRGSGASDPDPALVLRAGAGGGPSFQPGTSADDWMRWCPVERVEAALRALVAHHDALRLRFVRRRRAGSRGMLGEEERRFLLVWWICRVCRRGSRAGR